MYRLSDFNDHTNKYKFMQLLKQNWDNIHNEIGVFRYKVDKIQKKLVGEKYSIQLNPDRGCKRRAPEQIDEICQTFNKNQFNFTKASPKEIIFCIMNDGNGNHQTAELTLLYSRVVESDVHTLLVNVSPISHYHTLLCPSMEKCLPQIATAESLLLTVEIFFLAQNRDLRIGFNSLCGFASVNHLHYHLFIEKNDLPVESLKCNHLFSHIYCIYDYPIPGFCFEVPDKNSAFSVVKDINKLVQYFLKKSIAHNILLTSCTRDFVRVDLDIL
ncbi:GDP-D-glucose phosphorylase 1 [Aphomia sociella]